MESQNTDAKTEGKKLADLDFMLRVRVVESPMTKDDIESLVRQTLSYVGLTLSVKSIEEMTESDRA